MAYTGADDTKEQVRRAVDIIDLVGTYLPLRRQGRNFVATCPWHDDSRPSLQVNQERQSWKCWVCDIGGDVFSFLMRREGITFREALVMLAEKAGIPLPQYNPGPAAIPGSPNDKATRLAALQWAERLFHECLLHAQEAEPARKYLRDRGIDADSIVRYQIGFSPDQWQWMVDRAKGSPYSIDVLETVGLIAKSEKSSRPYDRFKGRVMFSIRDAQNRCIAFGGRILPGNTDERAAKYVNTAETIDFTKSKHLYGLNVVRDVVSKSRHVLVMEGYTDVVIARQCGIDNAVAVLGTALGPEHVKTLQAYADRVTLVLDGDDAGRRRANQILDLFMASSIDLRVVTLPEELDPADFLLTHGAEPFRKFVDDAVDALDHKIKIETHGIDVARDVHAAHRALENTLTTMSRAYAGGQAMPAGKQLREQQMVAKLARQFRLTETDVRRRLADLRQQAQATSANQSSGTNVGDVAGNSALRPSATSLLDPWERELLESLVLHPEAAPALLESISLGELTAEPVRAVFEVYLQMNNDGVDPEFSRVLGSLDDPRLQGFLVEIDELAHARDDVDPDTRVKEVLAAFARRRELREDRERMAALKSPAAAEDSDQLALELLLEEQRRRRLEIEAMRASEALKRSRHSSPTSMDG